MAFRLRLAPEKFVPLSFFATFVKLDYTTLHDDILWYKQKVVYTRKVTKFALSAQVSI